MLCIDGSGQSVEALHWECRATAERPGGVHAPVVLPQSLGAALAAEPALQRGVDDKGAEHDLAEDERESLYG